MKSDNCRFGLEIEFAGDSGLQRYLNSTGNRFRCGYDVSAALLTHGLKGLELKVRDQYILNKANAEVFFHELEILLEFIKNNGGRVHKKCGVHIHFSDPAGFTRERLTYVERKLLDRYSKGVNTPRVGYCRGDGHYAPIRYVRRGHYEARVFNSTLRINVIKRYFNDLIKAIDML